MNIMRCGKTTLTRDNYNIEWEATDADRKQAQRNHGQTLERLHERGGMSWCEMAAILEHREYRSMDIDKAEARVHEILQQRLSASAPSEENT